MQQRRMIVGKKRREKHFPKYKVMFGLLGFIIVFLIWATWPHYQTARYGICKTYIERNVLYPQTLEFVFVEETVPPPRYLPVVRMLYHKIGAFGDHWLNFAECTFRPDPQMGLVLDSVNINREKYHPAEDPERVESFNKTIPVILSTELDLTSPPELPEEIADYK